MRSLCSVALTMVFLTVPVFSGSSQKSSRASDFQGFWTDFRSASLANNVNAVVLLTQFPFKTRGTMDHDPVSEHDKEWLVKMYPQLLEINTGLSKEPQTMRALIERTSEIGEKQMDLQNSFRIGDFVYEKVKGRWVFTMAYWDPDQ